MTGSAESEREAVLAYAAAHAADVLAMAAAGKIGREEAELLAARIRAFASGIKTGLHLHVPR